MYRNNVFVGISSWLGILIIVLCIYMLIVMGRIIARDGDNGWKILIPIYGLYLFYKACDSGGLYIGTIVVSVLGSIISSVTVSTNVNNSYYYTSYSALRRASLGSSIIAIIEGLILLIIAICFAANTASAFGKSKGFAAGIFFLSPIFLGIIAFESPKNGSNITSKYASHYDTLPSSDATWKCSQCGKSNPAHRATCEFCGSIK